MLALYLGMFVATVSMSIAAVVMARRRARYAIFLRAVARGLDKLNETEDRAEGAPEAQ